MYATRSHYARIRQNSVFFRRFVRIDASSAREDANGARMRLAFGRGGGANMHLPERLPLVHLIHHACSTQRRGSSCASVGASSSLPTNVEKNKKQAVVMFSSFFVDAFCLCVVCCVDCYCDINHSKPTTRVTRHGHIMRAYHVYNIILYYITSHLAHHPIS